MQNWVEFAVALALFYASHLIPARPAVRAALRQGLGPRGYGAVYGLLSLALLAWAISAAVRAPFVPLWDMQIWQRWLVNLVMPLAVLLASFGIAAPNPLSFEGRASGFDPDHPGIAGVTRHPLLLALMLWSLAHVIVNGDLAQVLLFAPFAAFALIGMRSIDRRNRRLWGMAEWSRMTAKTSLLPGSAWVAGRWRPRARVSMLRFAIAVLIWLGLLYLHPMVIGVSPLP